MWDIFHNTHIAYGVHLTESSDDGQDFESICLSVLTLKVCRLKMVKSFSPSPRD